MNRMHYFTIFKLKFKEQDAVFVRHGKESYIQAKLVGIENEDQAGNGDG